jgi:hypothetical protein
MSQVQKCGTRHAESHPIPDAKCAEEKTGFQVGFATQRKRIGRDFFVLETLVPAEARAAAAQHGGGSSSSPMVSLCSRC